MFLSPGPVRSESFRQLRALEVDRAEPVADGRVLWDGDDDPTEDGGGETRTAGQFSVRGVLDRDGADCQPDQRVERLTTLRLEHTLLWPVRLIFSARSRLRKVSMSPRSD